MSSRRSGVREALGEALGDARSGIHAVPSAFSVALSQERRFAPRIHALQREK